MANNDPSAEQSSDDAEKPARAQAIENFVSSRMTIRSIRGASLHEGPLPDPETLQRYGLVYPGLEREIVEMAHAVIKSNIKDNGESLKLKSKQISANFVLELFGRISSLLVACAYIGFCYGLARSSVLAASILAACGVGATMTAFFRSMSSAKTSQSSTSHVE